MTQALRRQDARGQVRASAAEIYDEFFVPALFAEWAPRVLDAARLAPSLLCGAACEAGAAQQKKATPSRTDSIFVFTAPPLHLDIHGPR